MPSVSKYGQAFLVGLQSNLIYRWNFAVRSVFSLFNLGVVFILWGAAFARSPNIGGFTFAQTLTYFVILIALQFFIGAFNEDYQISEEIRNGLINQFLLKPINYFAYRLSIFAAARLVSGAVVLLPLVILVPFLRHSLALSATPQQIGLALIAALLAALVQFSIAFCFGMLTFWLLEIQGLVILSMAVESVLGGQMFPLDLLPRKALIVAQALPFYYQMYFPAAILTGRVPAEQIPTGLLIQAAWVVALIGISTLLWRRGLRRHTAVGG
ncbi:MAG TPA: ABC-2 family transporter protein [Opitutaceae bacterium]